MFKQITLIFSRKTAQSYKKAIFVVLVMQLISLKFLHRNTMLCLFYFSFCVLLFNFKSLIFATRTSAYLPSLALTNPSLWQTNDPLHR